MPIISRFFGIFIIMYWKDHNPPHFHVKYAEYTATIKLDGGLLGGYLSRRALSLVQEWLDLHRAEMFDNWHLAQQGLDIKPIAPLE